MYSYSLATKKIDDLFNILNDQILDIGIREKVNQVTLDELKKQGDNP